MGLRAAKPETEAIIPETGAAAYSINLTRDNKLGGGQYADVFKIQKINT